MCRRWSRVLRTAARRHISDFDDGNVEGTSTEVIHRNLLIAAFFVQAIGERRCGRLIDDALDVETRDAARVLGRLGAASR